jgi:uncharacterized protein
VASSGNAPARRGHIEVRAPGGRHVATAVDARSTLQRMRGLIGRRLEPGHGLLLRRCGSVHTNFMGYPIDVVYLSRDAEIVKLVPALRPWRFSWGGRRAEETLELASGEAERLGLAVGARLALERAATPGAEAA